MNFRKYEVSSNSTRQPKNHESKIMSHPDSFWETWQSGSKEVKAYHVLRKPSTTREPRVLLISCTSWPSSLQVGFHTMGQVYELLFKTMSHEMTYRKLGRLGHKLRSTSLDLKITSPILIVWLVDYYQLCFSSSFRIVLFFL